LEVSDSATLERGASRLERATTSVTRERVAAWTVALGLVSATVAIALTLTSDHVRYRLGDAVFLAANLVGLSLAAAAWLVKRPASWLGVALAVYAASMVLVSLQSVDQPLIYSLGVVGDWPFTAATFYVLVSFPTGRLTAWPEWVLMGIVMAVLAAFFLPYVLLSPSISGGHPLAECSAACPPNPLQVGSISAARLADIGKLEAIGAVTAGALLCAILLHRLLTATRPRRRLLVWVAVSGSLYGVIFALRQLTAFVVDAPADVTETARWMLALVRTLMPWAFLASIVYAQAFAGSVFARLVEGLADRPTIRQWESRMRRALDDSRLRLAFWSPAAQRYIAPDGSAVDPASLAPLSWHPIDRDGAPIGGLVHDPALDGDPELVRVAVKATLVARETEHMHDELRRASARLLVAAANERRKLERDLHDGAQQRLVALRVRLAHAAESGEPPSRRLLEELGAAVERTLDELRQLAQGIYPAVLVDDGLASALRSAARRCPQVVNVVCDDERRAPAEIEADVYFVCLEALQNASKHAGDTVTITVRLRISDTDLAFSVRDDGRGFPPERTQAGTGLSNMSERIAALGGRMDVRSAPGRGTAVAGVVPLAGELGR
jgi:signal transduction histidine kinase